MVECVLFGYEWFWLFFGWVIGFLGLLGVVVGGVVVFGFGFLGVWCWYGFVLVVGIGWLLFVWFCWCGDGNGFVCFCGGWWVVVLEY